ncbi:MAG: hypothetical protein UZ14_CFX002002334 [Chloroflexi bacterium OLB14]|nr:MAG: hypothetical protein UZ14_CFX002002334 [Chloroflexi bacterium OLB14]
MVFQSLHEKGLRSIQHPRGKRRNIDEEIPQNKNTKRRKTFLGNNEKEKGIFVEQTTLSNFEIEEIKNKVKFYKNISIACTVLFFLLGALYFLIEKYYPNIFDILINDARINFFYSLLILSSLVIHYIADLLGNKELSKIEKTKLNIGIFLQLLLHLFLISILIYSFFISPQ